MESLKGEKLEKLKKLETLSTNIIYGGRKMLENTFTPPLFTDTAPDPNDKNASGCTDMRVREYDDCGNLTEECIKWTCPDFQY